jgi:hypothetical protein
MPELIDVPLTDLEMTEEYSVIFPLVVGGEHESYEAEFVEGNTIEYMFKIVRVHMGPKRVGDTFLVRNGEQTFDIADRVGKYLILTEQAIPFPDDLADAHVETNTDAEIGAILGQGDNSMRTIMLYRLLMHSRSPARSPVSRQSPMFPRSHTPINGGRRRRRRTRRKRTARKNKKRTTHRRRKTHKNKKRNTYKRRR